MIIDVHCHVGLTARRIDRGIPRLSFEREGATGHAGFDSYLSPRLLNRSLWWFVRRFLKIPTHLEAGDELDAAIEAANDRHWLFMPGVDRLVLLAFDEYHDDAGRVHGPAERRRGRGSDLYASNSLVRALCRARPDRYLFGGSVHPYRTQDGRDACAMLEELAQTGAVLIKWLPIHQNIRAEDPRTVAFLRTAARLRMPMLIHYGGEMSLARQHMEFESPIPMLGVLRQLKSEGAMPTVIVAHVATPSFRFQSPKGYEALLSAMLLEFADDPLYADISALAAFGRTSWLRKLARRRDVHRKLVWGSDFPIPIFTAPFWRMIESKRRREIRAIDSWVARDLHLKRALGFDECVFSQAGKILAHRIPESCGD